MASDYVELGADLLPKDGGPVYAGKCGRTPLAVHNWSRIFDVGTSTTENLFMSWTRDSSDTDRVEWYDGETVTVNDSCAPYLLNTEYHIVMVVEPEGGATGGTRGCMVCGSGGRCRAGRGQRVDGKRTIRRRN